MQNWMLWAGLALIALWYFKPAVPGSANWSPAQVKEALAAAQGPQLIDVRTEAEFKEGHIKGAKLIPLHELGARAGEIAKDRRAILVCRSGNRSGQAYKLLAGQGYDKLSHLQGGVSRWAAEGLPLQR